MPLQPCRHTLDPLLLLWLEDVGVAGDGLVFTVTDLVLLVRSQRLLDVTTCNIRNPQNRAGSAGITISERHSTMPRSRRFSLTTSPPGVLLLIGVVWAFDSFAHCMKVLLKEDICKFDADSLQQTAIATGQVSGHLAYIDSWALTCSLTIAGGNTHRHIRNENHVRIAR